MRVVRRLVFFLAIVTTAIFIVFWNVWNLKQDKEAPEIRCEEEDYSVSIDTNDLDLMKGMEVWDEVDGEVTDSLVVEKKEIIPNTNKFIITYAASDLSHNISKYERVVTYKDYHSPHFKVDQPLRFAVGEESSLASHFFATDCIEGDITNRIKLEKKKGSSDGEGIQEYELSVSNRFGDVATLLISVEFYKDTYEERFSYPNIYLTDYIYYIKKGEKFKPENLLKEMQIGNKVYEYDKKNKKFYEMEELEDDNKNSAERKKKKDGKTIPLDKINCKSKVDTSKEGVYTVEYSYQEEERLGTTQLIVVVE